MRAFATRGSNRRQSGFTLLELVVAITLMGLVLVVLYGGLRLGLNGTDSGERRAEATHRLRLVQEFIRRQLAQSMSLYRPDERQEPAVVFAGRPNVIEFVAPMLEQLGQGGLYQVRIGIDDGRLWMRWRLYRADENAADEERETVLLEGVTAGEWAYFGPERDDDQERPRWRPDWTSTERRPLLVRLNLARRGEPWPDLVTALAEGPQGPQGFRR